jgi:hypothetical protein
VAGVRCGWSPPAIARVWAAVGGAAWCGRIRRVTLSLMYRLPVDVLDVLVRRRGDAASEMAMPDQHAEPVGMLDEAHQQVSGHLGHPRAGGVSGDPGQVHPSTLQFDHEQDVRPGQADRLHREEVAGHNPGAAGARRNYVQLGPPRRGAGPRRWRRRMVRTEVADIVTPSLRHSLAMRRWPQRALSRASRSTSSTTAGSNPRRRRPVAGLVHRRRNQLAVPPKHRRSSDQKDRPTIAGQQLRHRGQHYPVGRRKAWPGHLPAHHGELVAQHRNLHIFSVRV